MRFFWGNLLQSTPISENPPPWISHVSNSQCMSAIFLSRTSLVDALFRFPPTKRNMPLGWSWGIFPKRGTYQQADSASALLCSSCSISGCPSVSSMKSYSVLSSVVLLLSFDVLLESHVTYPIPLVILSKFSLFKFCCINLFFVLHLLLHVCLDWKQGALQAPCAECPRHFPGVISELGQEA
jgi:hypothetical protein